MKSKDSFKHKLDYKLQQMELREAPCDVRYWRCINKCFQHEAHMVD